MTSLESIVLPLAESLALVERGIVLDTVLRWVENHYNENPITIPTWFPPADEEIVLCPAPVLSELVDAIRAKVGHPLEERTVILTQDGRLKVPYCARVRSDRGKYELACRKSDLLAAAAILMEVSK